MPPSGRRGERGWDDLRRDVGVDGSGVLEGPFGDVQPNGIGLGARPLPVRRSDSGAVGPIRREVGLNEQGLGGRAPGRATATPTLAPTRTIPARSRNRWLSWRLKRPATVTAVTRSVIPGTSTTNSWPPTFATDQRRRCPWPAVA